LTLDANRTDVVLNGTNSGNEVSPIYHADNMEDGDHHLSGLLSVERFEIYYFECVMPLLHYAPRTVC